MMADPLIRLMGKSSRFVSLAFDWLNINLNEEMTLLLNSASQAQNRQQRRLAVVNAFEAKFISFECLESSSDISVLIFKNFSTQKTIL